MTETMKNELPSAIGVAFDGWTESSVHYLAVFAVGPGVKGGKVLLGFSPFDQEDKLDADEHIDYITSVLHVFDKDIATDVAYSAADNCSTNRSVATKTNIPLIGCNSHKLNLAVSSFFGLRHEPGRVDTRSVLQKARAQRLESVSSVMIKFRTIKGRATLKKYSTKGAILANKTRWNGNYRMVKRYLELKPKIQMFLDDVTEASLPLRTTVHRLMPSPEEHDSIVAMDKDLTAFDSVSQMLQKRDGEVSLAGVRAMFTKLAETYFDAFEVYLQDDSAIVHNKDFERAIVKHLLGEDLTVADEALLRKLELPAVDVVNPLANGGEESNGSNGGANFAASILRAQAREQQEMVVRKYVDFSKIPISSNVVERFFSQVKLTLTHLRNSLKPRTLETIMFLKMNATYMTKVEVHKALRSVPDAAYQEEEDDGEHGM
jgi:hypothetical protein